MTQEQLDELEPGMRVFHKAFGYGTIEDIGSSTIAVCFGGDAEPRTLLFPGSFYQGLLQL